MGERRMLPEKAPAAAIVPMSVKLIIFDLDGTLADTAADMADALNDVLPCNVAPVSVEEARMVMGGGEDMLAKRLDPERSAADRRGVPEKVRRRLRRASFRSHKTLPRR